MTERCPCRFNVSCGDREQRVQLGWVQHGQPPENVFREACPWFEGQLEQAHYGIGDGVPPEEKVA